MTPLYRCAATLARSLANNRRSKIALLRATDEHDLADRCEARLWADLQLPLWEER